MFNRVSSFMMPSLMSVPATRDIVDARSTRVAWIVPIDDAHFTTYSSRQGEAGRGAVPARLSRRQAVAHDDRGGAPGLSRRLRGPGRPGRDLAALRRASRDQRPWHRHDAPHAQGATSRSWSRAAIRSASPSTRRTPTVRVPSGNFFKAGAQRSSNATPRRARSHAVMFRRHSPVLPRRLASKRNQIRLSVSSIQVSIRLALATSP